MMSPKKGKGKKTPGKMSATKTTVTTTSVSGPISNIYVNRGYTDPLVELEHLKTIEVEVKRERGVTESCQADNAMLRE